MSAGDERARQYHEERARIATQRAWYEMGLLSPEDAERYVAERAARLAKLIVEPRAKWDGWDDRADLQPFTVTTSY